LPVLKDTATKELTWNCVVCGAPLRGKFRVGSKYMYVQCDKCPEQYTLPRVESLLEEQKNGRVPAGATFEKTRLEDSLRELFSSKESSSKKVAAIVGGIAVGLIVLVFLVAITSSCYQYNQYYGQTTCTAPVFLVWLVFLPGIWAVRYVNGMSAREKQKREAAVSLFLGGTPIRVGRGVEPLCPVDEVDLEDADPKALAKLQARAEKQGKKGDIYAKGEWKFCPKCKTFWDSSRPPNLTVESLTKWDNIVSSKVAELELAAEGGQNLLTIPTLPQSYNMQYGKPTTTVEQPPTPAMKYCRFCGSKIHRDSNHCEECGMKLTTTKANER
jgi:hypothetical protein